MAVGANRSARRRRPKGCGGSGAVHGALIDVGVVPKVAGARWARDMRSTAALNVALISSCSRDNPRSIRVTNRWVRLNSTEIVRGGQLQHRLCRSLAVSCAVTWRMRTGRCGQSGNVRILDLRCLARNRDARSRAARTGRTLRDRVRLEVRSPPPLERFGPISRTNDPRAGRLATSASDGLVSRQGSRMLEVELQTDLGRPGLANLAVRSPGACGMAR